MQFSKHAVRRLQQRGIRREAIRLVLTYGDHRYRNGAAIVSMDQNSRSEAASDLGPKYRGVADKLKVYAVVANGNVLTVAHPRQRPRSRRPSPARDGGVRPGARVPRTPSCRRDR